MIARILIGLLLLAACPALEAQRHDARARDITGREEYRGYRVESRPGGGSARGEGSGAGDSAQGGGDGSGYRRGTGSEAPPQRGTGADGPSRGSSSGLSLPGWIGALFEVLAWIVLIVGVVVALVFIIKALLGIKWKGRKRGQKSKKEKTASEPEAEITEEPPEDFDEQVFEDALEVALREYQEALARGDFAAATLLAYRVFWLRAGWKGCVESSDVRTWRDALRMVRNGATRREVRQLLPMVERVRYADYTPRREEFNNWSINLDRIDPQGVLK